VNSPAPSTPDLASQARFAQALLDPDQPCPANLRAWNGSDPTARLAVYRNNVLSSLVDALACSFPVLQLQVGEAFFRALAGEFVRRQPPRSPVLSRYGQALPDFIAGFQPASGLPWLPDLARLEFARVAACHAADAPALGAAVLAQALARPEALAGARLRLQPGLQVLASRWAVVSLWAAHQQGSERERDAALASLALDQPEHALVLRDPQWQVQVLWVDAGTAAFMGAVQQGQAFAAAAEAGLQAQPDFQLAALLGLLLQHGALTAIELP
jgi:hypothetical protein